MFRRSHPFRVPLVMAAVALSTAVGLSAQAARKPAAQAPKPAQAATAPKAAAPAPAAAAPAKVQQVVKPPVAQAWLDVATFSGFGMPNMGDMMKSEGGAMGAAMGSMFGGGRKNENSNEFLRTQTGLEGRWLDVTLRTSNNPNLAEATQAVPQGLGLAPSLKLQTPPKAEPAPRDDEDPTFDFERPKGKLYLYWGCGAEVREGQPKVLDLQTATPQELGQFFQSRHATQRGAHSAAGRPVWPSRDDKRLVPASGSLVGEHAFAGQGVPETFKFAIPALQDFMPEVALKQQEQAGAQVLSWEALEQARAYFISAMGARGEGKGDEVEMVLWTSSELPDSGFGLMDYQTNAAVDKWLGEKVLLPPQTTTCTVPKGIFGEDGGAMIRMIAYGNELNLVDPPRPADPKIAWEPVWSVKVRVKSVANAMLGMDMSEMRGGKGKKSTSAESAGEESGGKQKEQQKPKKKGLGGFLGGVIKP